MPVAVLVLDKQEARPLLLWAAHCARGLSTDVVALHLSGVAAAVTEEVLGIAASAEAEGEAPGVGVSTRDLGAAVDAHALLGVLDEIEAELVLVAKQAKGGDGDNLVMTVFARSPCDALLLRLGADGSERCVRILTPTAGGPHARVAVRLGAQIAEANDGLVDTLFVEPEVGEDAEAVGGRIVHRAISAAVGDDWSRVRPLVRVSNDVRGTISAVASEAPYDLLLIGSSHQGAVRRALFGTVPDTLLEGRFALTVGVVRRATPMRTRAQRLAEGQLRRFVPQLERPGRVALFEHVQSNSEWDFDFMALVCLSTLIAGLGLIQNSVAVVIGAMLLAPLMTPLVGGGLALVQGNAVLLRSAGRALLFGFFVAFGIAFLTGLIVPGSELTPELLARTSPNLLDLAVAFTGGVAGAYATARPNLSAALPGVAIAAALVPPIATAGIALARGEPVASAGAVMLFTTNIVAIVMGSAVALFAVGVRGAGERKWARRAVTWLLVAGAVVFLLLAFRGL